MQQIKEVIPGIILDRATLDVQRRRSAGCVTTTNSNVGNTLHLSNLAKRCNNAGSLNIFSDCPMSLRSQRCNIIITQPATGADETRNCRHSALSPARNKVVHRQREKFGSRPCSYDFCTLSSHHHVVFVVVVARTRTRAPSNSRSMASPYRETTSALA